MIIQFEKMHGLGNDFIMFNLKQSAFKNFKNMFSYDLIPKVKLQKMADRKLGIGCDQFIFYFNETKTINISIYNSDGSFAEMCGNAFRCLGLLMYKKNKSKKITIISNENKYDVNLISIQSDNSGIFSAEMGTIIKNCENSIVKNNVQYILNQENIDFSHTEFIHLGNTHLIIFLNDFVPTNIINKVSTKIHSTLADANISFAKIINDTQIDITVFERGVGLTDACGSAASAVAFCSYKNKFITTPQIQIHQKGGVLQVAINENNIITQTGSANYVFSGEILL